MAGIDHTVGGTDNLVSFRSAAQVPIDSLKIHFAPIQEGEGDPSPTNVRPITGWNAVEGYKTGKNIAEVTGYSAVNGRNADDHTRLTNSYGTTISTTDYVSPDTPLVVTQTQAPNAQLPNNYTNGYFGVYVKNLIYGKYYDVSLKITNVTSNPLDVDLNNIVLMTPTGSSNYVSTIKDNVLIYRNVRWMRYTNDTSHNSYNRSNFEIRNCGMSFTLSEFMVTPAGMNDGVFEPYCGSRLPVTFPLVGKNLFYISDDAEFSRMVPDATPGYYTNDFADIRQNLEIYIDAWDGNTYLGALIVYSNAQIGRFSRKVTIIQKYANTTHLRVKHNGTKADFFIKVPFTFVVGKTYAFSVDILRNDPTTVNGVSFGNIQVELGSTATEYEPATSDNTVYGGYIDLAKGEVQPTWYLYTLTGDESFVADSSGTWISVFTPVGMQASNEPSLVQVGFCTHYPYKAYTKGAIGVMYNERTITFDGTMRTAEEWKAFCKAEYEKGTPIQVCYPLKSYQQSIPIQKSNMITFLDQNTIWSNTNDVTEVSYAIHDSADIRAAKRRIAMASPHVETVSDTLAHFKTDISAPLKDCKIHFNPIQDLHGYDHPWIGGSGKNIVEYTNSANWRVAESATNRVVTSDMGSISLSNDVVTLSRTHRYAGLSIILGVLQADTQYTLSGIFTNIDGKAYIALLDGDISDTYTCTRKFTITFVNNTATFTPTETGVYELLVWSDNTNPTAVSNLQLEKGSSATPYEPYENICPISGWNGLDVTRCGKNFFDISVYEDVNGVTIDGDTFYGNVIALRNSGTHTPIFIPAGSTVRVSATTYRSVSDTGAGWSILLIYADGTNTRAWYTQNSKVSPTEYSGTIVAEKDIVSWVFCYYNNASSGIWYISNLTIAVDSSDTQYNPYEGQAVSVDWTDDAGTVYGGYVDLVTGEVWETHKKISITQKITQWNTWGNSLVYNNSIIGGSNKRKAGTIVLCDYLTPIGGTVNPQNVKSTDEIRYYGVNTTYPQYLYMANPDQLTIQEWRSWLTATYPNAHISFELETPILLTTLTPTQLKTLKGINNIWSDANGPIEVKYWTH